MSDKSEFVFSVTDKDFEAAVLRKSHDTPVVVDFWAPWCGPCRALAPVLERLIAQRNGDVLLAKVNTDDEQELAGRYHVAALPTVVAFRGGKPILSFEGVLPEVQLVDFLNQIVPSEADRIAREAAGLEKTNTTQAEKLLRLVDRHQDAEAAELIEQVGASGEQGAEAERLSAILWLRHQAQVMGDEPTLRERLEVDAKNPQLLFELGAVLAGQSKSAEALEMLLRAGQLDRKLAASKVRETMVKVFHVVGVRSPLADEYRYKLSSLLY
jgi:putative thioredoxin